MYSIIRCVFLECGLGLGNSGCQTRRFFTYKCGMIDVTLSPLNTNDYCQWSISVDDGYFIKLTFEAFNIPDIGRIICSSW